MKSAVSKHGKVFIALLICFILAMPLNNSYEVMAMMNGTLTPPEPGGAAWNAVLTPVYIKAIKDIFLALTVCLLIVSSLKSPSRRRVFSTMPFILLNLFSIVLILTASYSLSFMPADIVLMGLRGYWSIALVYAGAMYWDFNERRIYPYILAVFSLHFLLQVVQFITNIGFDVYHEHRSPGLFIIPATAGSFAILVHYFSIRFKSNPLRLISLLSLLLSNSTTGLLIILVYYIYSYRNKFTPKTIFYPIYTAITMIVSYVLISNLGEVTGRGGGASYSALTRLGILYVALTNWTSLLFGLGMGIATSQATLSGYSNAFIADNTYVGILYNAGIIPALLMLGFVCLCFRYFENKLLAIMLFGYSMTTVFFEINPIVQIVLILLGSHIGRKYAVTVADANRNKLVGTSSRASLVNNSRRRSRVSKPSVLVEESF